ncbi:ParB/RepB/Spo0J family partition protein [Thiothrix subterranea]|uniref:Probable chromosome-partitioning protein ParB n=1 Tax=Thiothrix subterranea TaxID=2735563 RepID=A0AA51MMP2_9GAMM|nr:ParB/RepB/Spo0J family partition protein [Thiothrix subterranea]MDQ5768416.1 ParB/RepB/Spo0J family partition protein [Thiothrix subterranea]QQZ28441.1 ParB/RepB/Spo0J family partition protein [Thiothrix subterranea]WML87003.1 ParB/RepB/Spo0J family partition protein [Thiothrix subterranea]
MAKKPSLGRGLDILLSSVRGDGEQSDDTVLKQLPVERIRPGQYQPRTRMDPDALQELADSIKAQGLVQPIVVRKLGGGEYELIAGERRWRASQLAGLHTIPAVVREVPDQSVAAMSLIENIQREDLNALEEASGLRRLIDEFGLTHQQTAEAVGRSRAAVTNLLRLLELQAETKALVDAGQLEMGHARALLGLHGQQQIDIAQKVAQQQLSVRETERLVKSLLEAGQKPVTVFKPSPDVVKLEQTLADTLGAKVAIRYNRTGKGKLVIEYNSLDELDGILGHIQ